MEPGIEADEQRMPKLLTETLELRDLDNDVALKDADFPFADLTRLGRGGRESKEEISGLGAPGSFCAPSPLGNSLLSLTLAQDRSDFCRCVCCGLMGGPSQTKTSARRCWEPFPRPRTC
jgi:hypothetical protein